MKLIQCKYVPQVVVPSNALSFPDCEYQTLDGKFCTLKIQIGWQNKDRDFDGELDEMCRRYHNCSFDVIRSIWLSRLGRVSDFWYLAELNLT